MTSHSEKRDVTAPEFSYVVVFFDRWEEGSISFVIGPYPTLGDAQDARARAEERIQGQYRQSSIQKCKSINEIPEWERVG